MMRTLAAEGCAARRQALIAAADVDILIITNPQHIQYLCGLYITPTALSAYGVNFLLIDAKTGRSTLLAHNFLANAARAAFVDEVQLWTWYDASTRAGIDPYGNSIGQLNARLGEPVFNGAVRVGVELGWLPYGVRLATPVDIAPILHRMRRHKYDDELVLIRDAVAAVSAGHQAARQTIRAGVSELAVYNAICSAMVEQAGHAILPMGDFAAGKRTGDSGGIATPALVQAGDLMIIDVFPVVNGYRADFTATYAVERTLTPAQAALERGLHDALQAGEAMLKPGVAANAVYQAVRAALAEHHLEAGFGHHAGHGIGLGHPEAPFFVPQSDEVLEVGDVVTLEPGSYNNGLGARIEHNYLITSTGAERLTAHSTQFIET
jgi:Xaa-Pro aminopeptidase